MKICIVIPVLNEAKTIGVLVGQIKKKSWDVVVVDDGSRDGSGNLARGHGAVVIGHEHRQGKGKSLRDGFEYVLSRGYDGIITMDGDGQHDVSDIEVFLNTVEGRPDCLAVGNRMQNPGGMPFIRLMTNWVMSAVISCVCRQWIADSQCGFRYVSAGIVRGLSLSSNNYEIESEMLIHASKKGYKIYSVAIRSIYRDEASKINPFLDTFRFLKFILRETFSSRS